MKNVKNNWIQLILLVNATLMIVYLYQRCSSHSIPDLLSPFQCTTKVVFRFKGWSESTTDYNLWTNTSSVEKKRNSSSIQLVIIRIHPVFFFFKASGKLIVVLVGMPENGRDAAIQEVKYHDSDKSRRKPARG